MSVTVNGNKVHISTAEGAAARADKQAAAGGALEGITYPQAEQWLETNVTSLATAKTALKHIVRMLFIQQAEINRLKTRMNRKDNTP